MKPCTNRTAFIYRGFDKKAEPKVVCDYCWAVFPEGTNETELPRHEWPVNQDA